MRDSCQEVPTRRTVATRPLTGGRKSAARCLRRAFRCLVLALPVAILPVTSGLGQEVGSAPPPLHRQALERLRNDPDALGQFVAGHARPRPEEGLPEEPSSTEPSAPAWTYLAHLLPKDSQDKPQFASNPLLLTDGTVLVHVSCSDLWYRLSPDQFGNYQDGTWTDVAPMVGAGGQAYEPRFFASAILPDGKVIVEGGEYVGTTPGNAHSEDEGGRACVAKPTTLGSIFDPRTNRWAGVSPPSGWTSISDASGAVLSSGTFLLSDAYSTQTALLNESNLTWTVTGSGKFDDNDEENWTLLPNGNILTVDTYTNMTTCGENSEVYQPSSGTWTSAGNTPTMLSACGGDPRSFEGPTQILQPNGNVAVFGATISFPQDNYPVYSAFYNTATGAWTQGPNMPEVANKYYAMADAPAAILPNGNVLIAASPSTWTSNANFPPPTHFFIFNGTSFTQVDDVTDSKKLSSYEMNFLVLPTGQILAVETDYPSMELFPAVCCANPAWAPTIAGYPTNIIAGDTYEISGTQFNGLTYGASYGDDEQASTNYPLVRVTNTATKQVTYCTTSNFNAMGVATGGGYTSADFTCDAPAGASTLEVVANGIASTPVNVTIEGQPSINLYAFCMFTNCPDGANPYGSGGVVMDFCYCPEGIDPVSLMLDDLSETLYGMTYNSGTYGYGAIFNLATQ